MTAEITGVKGAGDFQRERVVLRAKTNTDIGQTVVLCAPADGENIFPKAMEFAFWFPDNSVKKGDIIVLYTKSGEDRIKANANGTKSYFYYWGLTSPIWKEDENAAVVLQIRGWKTLFPTE